MAAKEKTGHDLEKEQWEKEKQKREKEREAREAEDKKIRDKKKKEKQERDKKRAAKLKKKENKERAKHKKLISFPFKTLFKVSLFLSLMSFIVQFFGVSKPLYDSLYLSFLIFVSIYLFIGLIIITVFFIVAEKRQKEEVEIKRAEISNRVREDEQRRKKEEEEKLKIAQDLLDMEAKREEQLKEFKMHQGTSFSKEGESPFPGGFTGDLSEEDKEYFETGSFKKDFKDFASREAQKESQNNQKSDEFNSPNNDDMSFDDYLNKTGQYMQEEMPLPGRHPENKNKKVFSSSDFAEFDE